LIADIGKDEFTAVVAYPEKGELHATSHQESASHVGLESKESGGYFKEASGHVFEEQGS